MNVFQKWIIVFGILTFAIISMFPAYNAYRLGDKWNTITPVGMHFVFATPFSDRKNIDHETLRFEINHNKYWVTLFATAISFTGLFFLSKLIKISIPNKKFTKSLIKISYFFWESIKVMMVANILSIYILGSIYLAIATDLIKIKAWYFLFWGMLIPLVYCAGFVYGRKLKKIDKYLIFVCVILSIVGVYFQFETEKLTSFGSQYKDHQH